MLTVQPNLNQRTKQSFRAIYGAQEAIRVLEKQGNKIRANQLREILPEVEKASEGVDIWVGDYERGHGFDIRVGEEIKEGHRLFDEVIFPRHDIEGAMRSRFGTVDFGTNHPRRAFGPIYYHMSNSKEFGKEVLDTIVDYKRCFLGWLEEQKNLSK